MLRSIIPALAIALSALPTAAADMTPLQAAALAEYERCDAGRKAGAYDYGLQACLDADAALTALVAANPTVPDYERDFLAFSKAAVLFSIGAAYGSVDGVRSARVCEQSERSWAVAGQIPETSSLMDMIRSMRQGIIDIVRLCRSEQGTPYWARAIP